MADLSIKNPYLLGSAGAPLVVNTAAGGKSDQVRQVTGVAALVAGGLFLATGSDVAKNVAVGAASAWGIMKFGVL